MPRIDLSVPYQEKDEAKSLGAKWDVVNKVWFVPDGLAVSPFKKWLPVKRPPPETIFFKKTSEGRMVARIDNLEIEFDGAICQIIVWGIETCVPCDYSDSACPEDKNRRLENCHKVNHCPYEFKQPVEDYNLLISNEGSCNELEAKVRDMLLNRHDGIGHRERWPEPAASEFACAKWAFEEKSWIRRIFGK